MSVQLGRKERKEEPPPESSLSRIMRVFVCSVCDQEVRRSRSELDASGRCDGCRP